MMCGGLSRSYHQQQFLTTDQTYAGLKSEVRRVLRIGTRSNEDSSVSVFRCLHAKQFADRGHADLALPPALALDDCYSAITKQPKINPTVFAAAPCFFDGIPLAPIRLAHQHLKIFPAKLPNCVQVLLDIEEPSSAVSGCGGDECE